MTMYHFIQNLYVLFDTSWQQSYIHFSKQFDFSDLKFDEICAIKYLLVVLCSNGVFTVPHILVLDFFLWDI